MADGPSTGHDDFLSQKVEESQTGETIKAKTLQILAKAEEVKNRLGDSSKVQKEYDDVRLATVGALKELQFSTSQNLGDFRNELTSQDDTLHNGEINQRELEIIKEELSDLQKKEGDIVPSESPEKLSIFGSTMLDYIENTNEAILNGGQEELNSQIGWYITAFGGEGGSGDMTANAAYYGAYTVLSTEIMSNTVSRLEDIKNSPANLETKLFQLSQILYEVGKEAGAPAELEIAHNFATRKIIQKVIENSDSTFAIGFNESTGYYTTENITSNSSELEIGTYLSSLNKSGKLTRENLLTPTGPFSPTELFSVLEQYKNGEFGGENIQDLFTSYLAGFEENMNIIMNKYVGNEENGVNIIKFLESQVNSGNTHTIYNATDIPRLESLTRGSDISPLQNTQFKKDLTHQRMTNLGEMLKKQIGSIYNQNNEGPEILDIIDALINFSINAEEGDFTGFDFSGINEIIQEYNMGNNTHYPPISEKFQNKISNIFDKALVESNYLESINSLDEINTVIQQLSEERQRLYANLSRFERMGEYEITSGIQQQINEIDEKLGLFIDKKEGIKNIVENINFDVYKDIENIAYDFNNESEVQSLLENRKYIKYISDENNILQLIEKSGGTIKPYEIHKDLQTNLRVLRALGENITTFDIYRMPDSFFSFANEGQSNYGKVYVLLSNIRGGHSTVIDKFIRNNTLEDKKELIQILYQIIQDDSGNLNELQKNRIKYNLLKKEEITIFLSPEQKDNLGYQSSLEENDRDAKEIFVSIIKEMHEPNYKDSTETKLYYQNISTVLTYIETYGFSEVKSEFSWIIRNKNIFRTEQISGIISTIPYSLANNERSEESMNFVLEGVTSRGANMIKPLSDKFKSDPSIIGAILTKTSKNKWPDILSYIHITDAKGVLALYKSTGNSINDTAKYLEFTGIKKEILMQIIHTVDENDLDIIQKIITKLDGNISIIMGNLENFRTIKQQIEDRQNIGMVGIFLEQYEQIENKDRFLQLLDENGMMNEEIGEIIYSSFNGDRAQIYDFINGLLQASIQERVENIENNGVVIIQQPITTELQSLLIKNNQEEYIIGTGQKFSQAFQKFLQENQGSNIENLRISFLLSIGIDENNINYNTLSQWLQSSENIAKLLEQQERLDEIAQAISKRDWEQLNEINISINNAYAKGEISYNYDDIKTLESKDSLTNKKMTSLNLQDTSKKISIELHLTLEEKNSLTQEELTLIASNEKVRENFIGFRETLGKLGLTELWKFRNKIFRTIGSLDFNISDGDYIGENELNIFLSKTVYATLQDPRLKNTPSNLETTKQIVRTLNNQTGGPNDIDNVSSIGEGMTLIENSFRQQFAPRNAGILDFKVAAFKKSLKGS